MQLKLFRFSGLLIFCSFWSFSGFSQYSPEFVQYKEKYPNSHVVRLNQETILHLELNKGELGVVQEVYEENLYLDETATYGSKKSLQFSSFFELEEIEASSLIYEKSKYKELKVKDFKIKDELDGSFYDDTKSLNFIFSNLNTGSKSKLKYSEKIKNPRFLSPFYFGDFSPVINSTFTIIADKDIRLRFQKFNTEQINLVFSEKEKRGKKIYTWEVKDLDAYEYEDHAPTFKKVLPHIIPIITSYKVNDNDVRVLEEVKDLYAWYYSMIKNINQEPDDEALVQLVNELTADKPTNLEKVKAIYYWTQQNIKYIDFEYELGGFIPRKANYVFQKKYGDCKDNSSILQRMLAIAGLDGNIAWIGTRSIPYSYEELPTPLVDNHMILVYVDNGKSYFLDATGRFLPMGFASPFIQGKEALISLGEDKFRIERVPEVSAKDNAVIDTTYLKLEDGNLKGSTKSRFSGYHKMNFFNSLENESTGKLKDFYNEQLQKGNNRFLIDDFTEINKYDYDLDFGLDYSFHIDDYAKVLGDEIYINLNMYKDLSILRVKEDRKNDIEYDFKTHSEYVSYFEIPEGYVVDFLPQNVELSTGFLNTSISYELEGNKIIYKHNVTLDTLGLNLEQQKELMKLIKEAEKAYKEIVVLKKA